MNVLSLFDGISCGRIALQRAGIEVDNYFASEVDSAAIGISRSNFPDIVQVGDITKLSYKDGWLKGEFGDLYVGKIDLLIGGSPCQGFSLAGKMRALDDPRSALFFEFERIRSEVKPTYFMLENVKMKKEHCDTISEIIGVAPVSINSKLVSAQSRPRLYWANFQIHPPKDKGITLSDVLDIPEGSTFKVYCKKSSTSPKSQQEKSGCLTAGGNSGGNHSDMDVVVFDDTEIPKTSTGRIDIHSNQKVRRYNLSEAERLQTLPVGYTATATPTQRYKAIGNGWTVDVIAHIFNGLNKE